MVKFIAVLVAHARVGIFSEMGAMVLRKGESPIAREIFDEFSDITTNIVKKGEWVPI